MHRVIHICAHTQVLRAAPPLPAPAVAADTLYEAARMGDSKKVAALLKAGAQPDALFRGIAISRGMRIPGDMPSAVDAELCVTYDTERNINGVSYDTQGKPKCLTMYTSPTVASTSVIPQTRPQAVTKLAAAPALRATPDSSAVQEAPKDQLVLPEGWKQYKAIDGRVYYHNNELKLTKWRYHVLLWMGAGVCMI
jgi:hypothetical protein